MLRYLNLYNFVIFYKKCIFIRYGYFRVGDVVNVMSCHVMSCYVMLCYVMFGPGKMSFNS